MDFMFGEPAPETWPLQRLIKEAARVYLCRRCDKEKTAEAFGYSHNPNYLICTCCWEKKYYGHCRAAHLFIAGHSC